LIDLTPLVRFGLVLVRTGVLVAFTPIFGSLFAPSMVKIGLAVTLAVVLAPVVALPGALTVTSLAIVVTREVAIGLALAMSVSLVVAVAELAGYLTGFQLGYSYASIIDPQTGVQNNTIATLYSSLALYVFFALDGHHVVIRALAASYRALPIGLGHIGPSLVPTVTQMLGLIFTEGVRLAAPVIVVLLVLELAIGLLTRAAPALNIFIIGYPLQLFVGLLTLAAVVRIVPAVTADAMQRALELAVRLAQAFR